MNRIEEITLRQELTDEDLLEIGKELVENHKALNTLNHELKSYNKKQKGKISEKEEEIAKNLQYIEDEAKYVDYICDVSVSKAAQTKTFTDKETGKIVRVDQLPPDFQYELWDDFAVDDSFDEDEEGYADEEE